MTTTADTAAGATALPPVALPRRRGR
ncbi:MAG: hypothetical protein AVDCRST_MAG66-3288, partial [uncultured Pseudonocardia sp.]